MISYTTTENRSVSEKKKKKWSIPELLIHIVLDILSRRPIKTIFDCQLVCKDWLSLISDPHFAKLHNLRSPLSLLLKSICPFAPRPTQLCSVYLEALALHNCHPHETQLKFNLNVNFPILGQKVVNCCNGLLCLSDCTAFEIYQCAIQFWIRIVAESPGFGVGMRGHLNYETIMILKSGKIVMLFNRDRLMLYNRNLGSFKSLNIYGIKTEFYGTAYISSFVSLKDVAKGQSLTRLRNWERAKAISLRNEEMVMMLRTMENLIGTLYKK
ncbi:hypothetical protein U1Q18_024430 [Sarracenia purpurea var. burkii]